MKTTKRVPSALPNFLTSPATSRTPARPRQLYLPPLPVNAKLPQILRFALSLLCEPKITETKLRGREQATDRALPNRQTDINATYTTTPMAPKLPTVQPAPSRTPATLGVNVNTVNTSTRKGALSAGSGGDRRYGIRRVVMYCTRLYS